jgi:RHS repeat-associated protein
LIARDRNADGSAATGAGGLEQRVYALQDANWNTTAIVAATGVPGVTGRTVINRFAYTPYGESQTLTASWATPAAGTTPATPWAHLFQGLEFTAMTGLAYVRHRDYSASLGRFIELDPIGFNAGDNNWYRFVGNGPTGKVDPSGLWEYFGTTDGDGNAWPHVNNDIDPQYPENDVRRFCPRWRRQLENAQRKLERELAKYDPIEDAKGDHPSPWAKDGKTKPGGHAIEIKMIRNQIKNLTDKINRICPPQAPLPEPNPMPQPSPAPQVIIVPPPLGSGCNPPATAPTARPVQRPGWRPGFSLGPIQIVPVWPTGPRGEEYY